MTIRMKCIKTLMTLKWQPSLWIRLNRVFVTTALDFLQHRFTVRLKLRQAQSCKMEILLKNKDPTHRVLICSGGRDWVISLTPEQLPTAGRRLTLPLRWIQIRPSWIQGLSTNPKPDNLTLAWNVSQYSHSPALLLLSISLWLHICFYHFHENRLQSLSNHNDSIFYLEVILCLGSSRTTFCWLCVSTQEINGNGK